MGRASRMSCVTISTSWALTPAIASCDCAQSALATDPTFRNTLSAPKAFKVAVPAAMLCVCEYPGAADDHGQIVHKTWA